jgi:hypothetical protein
MSRLEDSKKFRIKSVRSVAWALLALALSPTYGRADFLDDLFGPPEPAPRVGPTPHVSPPSGRTSNFTARRYAPIKSEVRFLRKGVHTEESNRRARQEQDDSSRKAEVDGQNKLVAGSKPTQAFLCASKSQIAAASPSGLLLYDRTLRSGDILVTDKGVQVYRGHTACPHDSSDFIALSTANVSRSRLRGLLAIEKALHRQGDYLLTAKSE